MADRGAAGGGHGAAGRPADRAAVGYFLVGFVGEFEWLMILIAEAGLASIFFGKRMGPGSLGTMAAQLVLYGLFSLLMFWPARKVVQGWLGMVSGVRPESYRDTAMNLGAAVCDLVVFAGFLVLMVVASGPLSEGEDPSSLAFGFSFTLFVLLVFGVGSAVPRFWFATRRTGRASAGPAPELLVQAGKRASRFCYAVFLTMGLAMTGARVTALARGLAAAPLTRARRCQRRRRTRR